MNAVVAYFAGLLTLPVLAGAAWFFQWAFSAGWGSEGCYVCEHGARGQIGDHRSITMWLWQMWHRYFWSKRRWHREAWAVHRFNPANRHPAPSPYRKPAAVPGTDKENN